MSQRTIILILIGLIIGGIGSDIAFSQESTEAIPTVLFFYSPTCHTCAALKDGLFRKLEKEFKDKIVIDHLDITELKNYKLLLTLLGEHNVARQASVVPAVYLQEELLVGESQIQRYLKQLIVNALSKPQKEQAPTRIKTKPLVMPAIDLIAYFKSYRPFAIISAGLVDGINPCAFTVIVFFISFLALQGYRKRELIVIGLSFIFAVFLTYIFLGLGLFGFLYRLQGFWYVSRIANVLVGMLAILLGFIALYDLFKYHKTKNTEGLLLQLPPAIKRRIQAIIGLHYRKTKAKEGVFLKRTLATLILSAFTTGFLVAILEAICTGQVYLPTIVLVLKTTPLKIQALGYLLLYNLMFILPLFLIFCLALWGVTSDQFSRALKRHLLTIKLLMALLFFSLGATILYAQFPRVEAGSPMQMSDKKVVSPEPIGTSEPYAWDFGTVKEGEILTYIFILKNGSASVLTIKDVNTSCGCTASQVEKKVLSPGESTPLEVKLDTKGYSGSIQQFVYVYTDNLDNPIIKFTIKANVVKQ